MRQFNCFSVKSVFVVLLFSLQGCATEKFDVVIPSIETNHNWSRDAANYFDYRESFFGPRLSVLISPEWKPAHAPAPLRMGFLFTSGFEAAFQLDTQQTFLEIEGK